MPVISLPSFSKGEIGPSLYGRVDTNMYKVALRTARNAIIHSYGGVSNRPGTLCITPFKFHTLALFPRIFRFHQGTSDQYVLEVGNLYMRFVRNDAQVLDTATTITITGATAASPVVVTASAHGRSNGDDVFINMAAGMVELNKRRFIVRAATTNTFELEDQITGVAVDGTGYTAYTTGGDVSLVYEIATPYLQADLATLKMVQTGNTITITHTGYAPKDLTRTDHDDWTLVGGDTASSGNTFAPSIAAPTGGTISSTFDSNFQVFTEGGITVSYRITAISDTDGRFEESLPLTITGNNGSDPPLNTLEWAAHATADRFAVYRQDNGLYGLLGETELTCFEDKNLGTDLTISPPAARNPFSSVFPMASGYYQQRQVYGGTTTNPDRSEYSQVGLRLNMSVSTPLQPADSITADLASQDVQEIRHYVPIGGDLMVMTNAGEWRVNSGPDSGFSQDTIKQLPETNWGSSHDVPIVIGKTILFVEDGAARVRSLGFSLELDGFDTNDLTILANHFLADKGPDQHIITDWAYAQFPEPRVFMVRSDGKVLTMTFDTEQKVIAWTSWDTRGLYQTTTTLRRSVNGVEDGVYFGIRRKTHLGGDMNLLERVHSRKFADIRAGFFLDMGFKLDDKFTITNITDADPTVITTDSAHGFADGDTIELVDIEWYKALADECDDEAPDLFNNTRHTVANKTATTFELLSHTTSAGGEGYDLTEVTCPFDGEFHPDASDNSKVAGLDFNADGTKMYLTDLVTSKISQYSVGLAYDTGTVTPDGVTVDLGSDFNNKSINAIQWVNSGNSLWVMANTFPLATLIQYDASVAYDLTTLTLITTQTGSYSQSRFHLSNDGLNLYWARSTLGPRIFQFKLSTAFSLGSIQLPAFAEWLVTDNGGAGDVFVRPDGTVLYTLNGGLDTISQFNLSTAFDLNTISFSGIVTDTCGLNPQAMFWSPNGGTLVVGDKGTAAHANRIEHTNVTVSAGVTDVGLPSTEIYRRGGVVRKCVTKLTGLWCQEGLEVALLFDGNVEENQTVVNGALTVAEGRCITRAAVGLPYTTDIELLDIEVGSGSASSPQTLQGKLKKISKVMVRFHRSRMPQVGPRSDHLIQMRPRKFEKYDEASQLISGDVSVAIKPSWNSNGRIFFRQCDPVPLTILAVFPDLTPEDELE